MDVDIHFAVGQFEEKQHYRKNSWRQDVAISLGECVLNEAVTDQAAVDEDVDRVAVEFLNLGLRDEAVYAQFAGISGTFRFVFFRAAPRRRLWQADLFQRLHGRHRNQLVENLLPKNLINALAVARYRGRDQHGVGSRVQLEVLVRMRQRVLRDQGGDMGKFGGLRLQKFLARGDIEKKITNGERGPHRQAGFFYAKDLAAVDFDDGSRGLFRSACFQMQARN